MMMTEERINWSAGTKLRFEEWLVANRERWRAEGADADEVAEDVTLHLEEKFAGREREVGISDLKCALAEMGMPAMGEGFVLQGRGLSEFESRPGFWKRFFVGMTRHPFWVLGVPLLVVLLDVWTGMSGAMLGSALVRWPQYLLVGFALFAGWFHFFRTRDEGAANVEAPWWHGLIRGAGLMVAGYYAVLYLPLLIGGTLIYISGVVMTIGLGLLGLPFFFVCVVIAMGPLLLMFGLLRKRGFIFERKFVLCGLGLGLLGILFVEVPGAVTDHGVRTGDAKLVRDWGSESVLRTMAEDEFYEVDSSALLLGFVSGSFRTDFMDGFVAKRVSNRDARLMYYRVFGESVDVMERDRVSRGGRGLAGRNSRNSGWEADEHLGGEDVMGVWEDLAIDFSRLDGHVDAASGLGYWEWTMEFENTANIPREARMQILLPPHGVVSRLTLWVNGEPREAAFASTAKVAAAYKKIAVVQRRDPVLVRWIGPDRVMVQCFPVPVGGKMKIRVGVTAEVDELGRFYAPRMIEQNFVVPESLKTGVWVQGDSEFEMEGVDGEGASGKWRETHGELATYEMTKRHAFVRVGAVERPVRVWTEDRFAEDGERYLVGERVEKVSGVKAESAVVAVVDGSAGVKRWRSGILDGLRKVRDGGREVKVVVATDDGAMVLKDLDLLEEVIVEGGQDNQAGLLEGFELAAKLGAGDMIWFHGNQPVRFEKSGGLEQVLERSFSRPRVTTVDLGGGANRILEDLGKAMRINCQERPSDVGEVVGCVERALRGESRGMEWTRVGSEEEVGDGVKVWDQLARWKVWSEVEDVKPSEGLVALAARYQLVTPVSGAVVLETKADYDENGLEAVDVDSVPKVPTIPEPSVSLMLLICGWFLVGRRRRVVA